MVYNEFGLLHEPWDYFVRSIKVTPNRGVTLIDLLCKFTSKGHFYPKNKFQEVTEKNMNVLHIQECRDIIVSLNIEILEKP